MRNVKRKIKPPELARNASSWKKELLRELDKGTMVNKKKLETIYRRYNIPNVKKTLNSMYNNHCCYCESKVGVVDYPHIEHRKPKRKYPELTFDWDNLNLACEVCNKNKGEKYNKKAPILDAVKDNPITKHLSYRIGVGSIDRTYNTERGKTTIEHTKLNRDLLSRSRVDVFWHVMNVIDFIKSNPRDSDNELRKDDLKRLTKGQYGSMIKWLMGCYLN
ncbi:MAG: HNH endonuclease [Candidatus Scalinduaceae bacterium]